MVRPPLYAKVLAGVGIGILLGKVCGTRPIVAGIGTAELGEAGMVVIRVLKALATPLIFFAVTDAVIRIRIPRKKGLALLALSSLNAAVAVVIGIGVARLMHAGAGSFAEVLARAKDAAPAPEVPLLRTHPTNVLAGFPENLIDPFRSNSIITVVLLGLAGGFAIRQVLQRGGEDERDARVLSAGIRGALHACTRLLEYAVEAVPLAVLLAIAGLVGKSGIGVFSSLGVFLGTMLLGLALHAIVYYSLLLWAVSRRSPFGFWRSGADALVTALSCGSSLVTLPVTLRCLRNMEVSTGSARLAACIGTNLNHDGIVLYEAAATLFVAQALHVDLSLGAQLAIAAAAVLAGFGMPGVPEAGLVTMPLVFAAGGLPASIAPVVLPLILPVDWLIGRCRAAVNVTSDMVVATLLDRLVPGRNPEEEHD